MTPATSIASGFLFFPSALVQSRVSDRLSRPGQKRRAAVQI